MDYTVLIKRNYVSNEIITCARTCLYNIGTETMEEMIKNLQLINQNII
jgi:hypothetical protein